MSLCWFRLFFVEYCLSHISHLNLFSFGAGQESFKAQFEDFSCVCKWPDSLNAWPHLQWKGFSLLWIRKWVFKLPALVNLWSHISHSKAFIYLAYILRNIFWIETASLQYAPVNEVWDPLPFYICTHIGHI